MSITTSDLAFVIATNLSPLNDEMLRFCDVHDVFFSTSLDGPADLHNRIGRGPAATAGSAPSPAFAVFARRLDQTEFPR